MTPPFSFDEHLDALTRMEFLFHHPDRTDVPHEDELEDLAEFDDPFYDDK